MPEVTDRLMDQQAMGFIDQIGAIFKNLPHLPKGIVDFLVMIAPWMAAIGGVLTIIGALSAFGVGAVGAVIPGVGGITLMVSAVIDILMAVLLLMAFSPLRQRVMKGWILMFWAQVLSLVSSAIGLIYSPAGIIGLVIGALIGMYILFEMRPAYNGVIPPKAEPKV